MGGPSPPSTAQPLSSLSNVSPVSTAEKIALSDAGLRKVVAVAIVLAFLAVNGAVLWGIWVVFQKDIDLLTRAGSNFTAADRLVTTNLLMTLVGATTVQLGALIVLMGKYLFPAPRG
jgi:hypothetical protein